MYCLSVDLSVDIYYLNSLGFLQLFFHTNLRNLSFNVIKSSQQIKLVFLPWIYVSSNQNERKTTIVSIYYYLFRENSNRKNEPGMDEKAKLYINWYFKSFKYRTACGYQYKILIFLKSYNNYLSVLKLNGYYNATT